jgi:hypothetical protein
MQLLVETCDTAHVAHKSRLYAGLILADTAALPDPNHNQQNRVATNCPEPPGIYRNSLLPTCSPKNGLSIPAWATLQGKPSFLDVVQLLPFLESYAPNTFSAVIGTQIGLKCDIF